MYDIKREVEILRQETEELKNIIKESVNVDGNTIEESTVDNIIDNNNYIIELLNMI